MSFPAYPEYKNSEVDWLGDLPTQWEVRPFWSRFRRTKAVGYPDEVLLSVYRDHGVVVKSSRDDNFNKASEDLSSYQLVSEGNLAMNKMKAWQGSLGISSHRGIVSPAYFIFDKLTDDDPRYLNYLLRSKNYATAFMTISKGIRVNQWDVDPDRLRLLPLVIPPQTDQRAIAAFLDRETAKIDAAVAAQERLITLLAEKRAATISRAVTNGLDPDATMKDSGIEWLGRIPAHWDAKRLRFLCKIETGDGDTQDAVEDGDYPFFVRSPNIEGINRYSFDCEAVMTSGDGAGVGKIYHHYAGKFTAHQRVYVFHGFDGILPRLVYHYFKAYFARVTLQGTAKSTVESLRRPMLADFWIVVPDKSEQAAVLNFCEATEEKYNGAIERCEEGIRLLRERRAALISAAVTGKIDVRGEVTADNVVSLDKYRAAVGAVAIAKLGKMGRMAVMKAGYLAEAHAGMHELQGHYERDAAGPYCSGVVRGMERGAADRHGITVRENEGKATYDLPAGLELPVRELRDRFGTDRANRYLSLVSELSGFSREGVEAIATLYAAWNDLLARGGDVTDDAVHHEVLENWHDEKRTKFNTEKLAHWMGWMRRNGVVPDGTAPRTDHQAGLDL